MMKTRDAAQLVLACFFADATTAAFLPQGTFRPGGGGGAKTTGHFFLPRSFQSSQTTPPRGLALLCESSLRLVGLGLRTFRAFKTDLMV